MGLQQGASDFGEGIARLFIGEHKRREADREAMQFLNTLAQAQLPDPENPEKGKPVFSKETQSFLQQQAQLKGAQLQGSQQAIQRILPYMLQQAVREPKYPVQVGDRTVEATGGQVIQQDLEKQRIDIAKQPRGPSAYSQFKMDQAKKKELQVEQEKLPEFQFTKKYQLLPKDILSQQMAYETQFKNPDETDPAKKQVLGYIPTTPVYRERKYQSNQNGIKQEAFAPDPEGDIVNFKGQRIPFQDYSSLLNRSKFVYDRAKAALQRGTPPEEIARRLEQMGFDPAGVQ